MTTRQQKVVIIGAGIGGLASANLLALAGYDVTVYEKNAQPGGRAGQLKAKGFTFDSGPSWYLMPEVFEQYYALLGEDIHAHLDLIKLSPAYKVFYEKTKPVTITSDQRRDEATFESIEKGAGKALGHYVKRGQAIYDLAIAHFLYSNFTSIRDWIHPAILSRGITMLRLSLTPISRYINSFVQDKRLQQILQYPMVFLGTSPFHAPAIYSLMSALDFRQGVYYPRGGMYAIIESLVKIGERLGVTYVYTSPVTHISTHHGQVDGVSLESGKSIQADIVIANADLHFTETSLLDAKDQTYPESYWSKKEPGPSALLLYIGVKGKLPNLEHHSLLFVDAWRENFEAIYDTKTYPHPASLYICKPSGIDLSVAPKGHENLFVLVPLPAGKTMDPDSQQNLAESYLDQIATMTKTPDLKKRIVFMKTFGPDEFNKQFHSWQSSALGMSHILRQSAFFRTPNNSKKVSNLYYVGGTTMPGIGLPMCLISAELIYKRLSGDKRGGHVSQIDRSLGVIQQ